MLWSSGIVTFMGSMVTYVALPFQVKELTDSYIAVGLLGAAQLIPLIVFGLWGGALADAMDRRKLVLVTEFGLFLATCALLTNALLPSPSLALIYVIAVVFTVLDALQRPSLDAITPRVVPHDQLAAAGALNSLRHNIGMIVGPALGGIVIASGGVAAGYAFDAITFVASVMLLASMKPVPSSHDALRPSLASITEGIRYAWSRKDLLGTYAIDMAAMVLAFPIAIFPFIAERYPDQPWVLGFLYSAMAVGSLVATLTSGWTARIHHHGRAIVAAAATWGAGIAVFGLMDNIWLSLLFLAIAGGADMISGIFRSLIWNQTIPDEYRGRLAGIELLSYATGPQLGQVRVSAMAAFTSLRFSVAAGGVMCVAATVALVAALPTLWKYDARTDENAVREREIRKNR